MEISPEDRSQRDELYAIADKILTAEKEKSSEISSLSGDFLKILAGAQGGIATKKVASMLIPRYAKHFSEQSSDALNAMFDLCEDEDNEVRLGAIRGLAPLCEAIPENVPKVADILAQLLLTDDKDEMAAIRGSFQALYVVDVAACLHELFNQFGSEEEQCRSAARQFLMTNFPPLEVLAKSPEAVAKLLDVIKQNLARFTDEDAAFFFGVMRQLGGAIGAQDSQTICEGAVAMLDSLADFNLADSAQSLRVLEIVKFIVSFRSVVHILRVLRFIEERILPRLQEIGSGETKIGFARVLADAVPFASAGEARPLLPHVYAALLPFLPSAAVGADQIVDYSMIEALLTAFNLLAMKSPGLNVVCGIKIVTGHPSDAAYEDHSAKKADFVKRLKHLEAHAKPRSEKIVGAIDGLKRKLKDDSTAKAKLEMVQIALKEIQNVQALTKQYLSMGVAASPRADFSTTQDLKPSWKAIDEAKATTIRKLVPTSAPKKTEPAPAAAASSAPPRPAPAPKRPAPTESAGEQKDAKQPKIQIYVPPSRREGYEPKITGKAPRDPDEQRGSGARTQTQRGRGLRGRGGRRF